MPTALEKLVKILRLEQETGYKNTAVIGGLPSYLPVWTKEAHQQAKTNTQHALIDELSQVITYYGTLATREERQETLKYMLGRITQRVPARPEFIVAPSTYPVESIPPEDTSPAFDNRETVAPVIERVIDKEYQPELLPAPELILRESFRENQEDIVAQALELQPLPIAAPIIEDTTQAEPKPPRTYQRRQDLKTAKANLQRLNADITDLKGIGKKRAEQLAKLGIYSLRDLLLHLPRRYDDYSRLAPINRLVKEQQVAVIGTIRAVDEKFVRGNRPYLQVIIDDGSGQLRVTFFNQNYLKHEFTLGTQILFYGKTDVYAGKITMTNPEWEFIDQHSLQKGYIIPVYPLTEGVSNKMMRSIIKQALDEWTGKFPDYIPDSVLDRTDMMDLGWTLRQIHLPKNWAYLSYAQERLAFEELMLLQLGILTQRRDWQAVPGIALPIDDAWLNDFVNTLPYALTNAQIRAVEAIRNDLELPIPMNRLLQGDVGAGKTVVAAMALGIAVANGKQAAIMAPTSVLAEQHYKNMQKFLLQHPALQHLNIRLLTGAISEAERREIYEGLSEGSIHLVVGTQALIQEKVEFAELALAVIDEQHRFGVEERGALRGKGTNPHILVMTATPIPRTLALTMYADLDLTVLDEMPPGRTPIQTKIVYTAERERAYRFIEKEIALGRQAFIVYPLVDVSETLELGSAIEAFEDLRQTTFRKYRLGLLHGRMKPQEKDEVMAAFGGGQLDILVSTSVIEVGIDVPNASVMLIEGASRFGLAQLHQLRGRVGRGQHESFCFLMSENDTPDAIERLKAVEETTDGFELAKKDWDLRGPGDLLGTRQAGFGPIQLDRLMNLPLVEIAQTESRTLFEEDPYLEHPDHVLLAEQIQLMQGRRSDVS